MIYRNVNIIKKQAAINMKETRNSSFDFMKCIAAFFVINIHYGFEWLNPITRCAVPIFFIISGYYYSSISKNHKLLNHIKKIVVMGFSSSILYALWEIQQHLRDNDIQNWFATTINKERIINFIVFGEDLFGYHLWYFYATIFSLIVLGLTDKLKLKKIFVYITPILLCCFYIGNATSLPNFYFRNGLFMGLPCMTIGILIRDKKDKYFSFLSRKENLFIYTVLFLLLVIIEFILSKQNRDMYIFDIPLIIPFIYCAIRNPQFGKNSLIETIGKNYSAYIYIFHIIAANIISHFHRNDTLLMNILFPFLVFIVSLCMAWTYTKFKSCLKKLNLLYITRPKH